jgi:hypothetical protein
MSLLPTPDPGLAALLVAGRAIHPLPDVVRARAIGRARASLRAHVVVVSEGLDVEPVTTPLPPPTRFRLSVLAFLFLGIGIGGIGTALAIAIERRPSVAATVPVPLRPTPQRAPAVRRVSSSRPIATETAATPAPLKRSRATVTARESFAAELDLLHRAQAALGRRDVGTALTLIAEHAGRFPHGRLAEEREALRVRALAASGRVDEARRAGIAFADRFPRSVLGARLQETPPAAW